MSNISYYTAEGFKKLKEELGYLKGPKKMEVAEKIKEIAFDYTSKSYEYALLNPELGYIYRIKWDR
jgi:transcription elongation GreA/GreB family factor